MCNINANELKNLVDGMASAIAKEECTKRKVIEQLTAKAAEMRAMADALTQLANNLRNGLSDDEPAGRRTVSLKEGERHPKAKQAKISSKPSKPKYHKPTQAEIDAMTPERRAKYYANVERCRMMREAKKKNSLVEKFAQTKIS